MVFLPQWKLSEQKTCVELVLMGIIRHWLALILLILPMCTLFSGVFLGEICLLGYYVLIIGSSIEKCSMH